MDDKKVNYGLGDYDTELASKKFVVSDEEKKQYGLSRDDAEKVAYDTIREDTYKDRINSNLEAVSIGEDKVPNPEYDREYTSERAESLLNSLNETKKTNNHSLYNLPVYEVLNNQKTVVKAKEQSSINVDKIKQIAKYIAIAAVSGAITITAIKGGIDVVKNPDPVTPNTNTQTMELEENINDAENFDEVINTINENKEFNQNVYDVPDDYDDTISKGGRTN